MGIRDRARLHHHVDALSPALLDVVKRSPDVLAGLPVFRGTRVPVTALLDYLAAGDSLDTFLEDFPSVHREQAIALLELMDNASIMPDEPERLATSPFGRSEISAARPSPA
jgi:uncharacterized protein (DUF433 family)